jgi:hypothetical protein
LESLNAGIRGEQLPSLLVTSNVTGSLAAPSVIVFPFVDGGVHCVMVFATWSPTSK